MSRYDDCMKNREKLHPAGHAITKTAKDSDSNFFGVEW